MKSSYLTAIILIISLPILYSIYEKSIEINRPSISSIVTNQNGNHILFFCLMLVLSIIVIEYEKIRNDKLSYYSLYFISMCVLLFCFFHPSYACHKSYAALAFFAIICFMLIHLKKSNILTYIFILELLTSVYLFYVFPKVFAGQIVFLSLFMTYFIYLHFIDNSND